LADHAKIVVVGSINMDLVARVRALPRAGQTVHGSDFRLIPGGKGANQAVAAARLGARCAMVGRVGDDEFAPRLRDGLARHGVAVDLVPQTADCPSGVALIAVEDSGENAITIIAGANGRLSPDDVAAAHHAIAHADAVLLQLEVPLETVAAALEAAARHRVPVVLDPAPAPERMPEALLRADVLCPNQSEAEAITGMRVADPDDADRAAAWLVDRGTRLAVITLGRQGALARDHAGWCEHVPAPPVDAVDATAAGDAFAAAGAVALAERRRLRDALDFACAAGSLAATRFGAQPAMPDRAEVERMIAESP